MPIHQEATFSTGWVLPGPRGLRHQDKYRPSSQQINKIKLLFDLFDVYEQLLLPSLTIYSDIMNIKIINIIN